MAETFLGEIRIFGFNFAPQGWAQCNGQTLAINQNTALFALLGTTYGGNGQTTFQLPNLQGCAAMHFKAPHPQGQTGGEIAHTLVVAEMPVHAHTPQGNTGAGTVLTPGGNFWAKDSGGNATFGSLPSQGTLSNLAIANAGGGQPHDNMMPYLVLNFCIALQGIFPSQN